MTYALLGVLVFNTVAKRDAVYGKIETFISDKPKWGSVILSKGVDDKTGNFSIVVEVRFSQRPNLDNLFDLAKMELNKLTGITATFSKHVCSHDEIPVKPCVIEEIATIVR